jgi:hypothetical protein
MHRHADDELRENGKPPRKARRPKKRDRIRVPTGPRSLARALVEQLGAARAAAACRALTELLGSAGQKRKAGTRTDK